MKSQLLTGAFWVATAVRAVKTAAQTTIALLVVDQTGHLSASLATMGVTAGVAAVATVLTCIASADNIIPTKSAE